MSGNINSLIYLSVIFLFNLFFINLIIHYTLNILFFLPASYFQRLGLRKSIHYRDNSYDRPISKFSIKAFEHAFKIHYPELCKYCIRFVQNEEIAEDIVQELFFKIWNKGSDFSISSSLKSYLYKATYNNSIEYLRTLKNEILYKDF